METKLLSLDPNPDVSCLRQALRAYGYTSSTVRSYSFYIKDYLSWLASLDPLEDKSIGERSMVRYAVYLKETRRLGESAVAQAVSAVTFYVKNVVWKAT